MAGIFCGGDGAVLVCMAVLRSVDGGISFERGRVLLVGMKIE